MLHITNGSSVVALMREAGIPGRIVPWDDVLHEGPVPAGLNAAALRDVRADFLATFGGPPPFPSRDVIARDLAARDDAVEQLDGVDEIVLWLEHDLYDQLQLIQILDRLPADRGPAVTAVPSDDYLGTQPAARFTALFAARQAVTSAQRVAARDAWDAFRSADPRTIADTLDRVTALPHLAPALRRHLQQFPSIGTGLSRTEQQALEALARGVTRVKDVYVEANHKHEEAVFMGDAAFLFHIHPLLQSPRPLIRKVTGQKATPFSAMFKPTPLLDDEIELTDDGKRVLDGSADRVRLCRIDRWLGGVHLTGYGPLWRWDQQRGALRVA